jgi:formylglycine-generating enzyme required for sulfatase activity
VIGNSAYAGDNFLTNPVNDAKALAKVLRQLDFEVISKTNLNRKQMKTAIFEFSRRLSEEQGVGLFYFSGHGLQYQGINYLIPIGAQQTLKAAYQLPDETVTMDYVLSAMKDVDNKVNLLILDACRNPPRFVKSWYKGDMIPPGLALPQRTPGASLIAYAAAPGQPALSGEGQDNSPYVKSLMKWIQVPNLSITDALTQVRKEVLKTTYQMQEPEFSVALNEPFYFNRDAKTDQQHQVEQARLAQEKAQLQAERDRLAQEREAMQREQARLQAQAEARFAQEREALKQEQAKLQAEQERLARRQRERDSTPITSTGSGKFFRDRLKDGSQGPEMVRIKGGSFRMGDIQGSGDSDEKPVHSVSVAPFAMGRYEVTVGEFRQFVNATGYKTDAEKQGSCWAVGDNKGKNWRNLGFSQTDTHPVVCVSWNDATAYAKWLSQQTGHTYRLPTEAQWEYAARAGTTTSRYWGNDPNDACRYANVADKTAKNKYSDWTIHNCTDGYVHTAPVGRFKPNAFDLFDMLGNVWEWTCSEYENRYNGKESKCIRQNSGSLRALRGGAWDDKPWSVRAAYRLRGSRDDRNDFVGLRLARLLLGLGFLALAAFRFWGFGFLRFLVFDFGFFEVFGFFARAEHGPDFLVFFFARTKCGPEIFFWFFPHGCGADFFNNN